MINGSKMSISSFFESDKSVGGEIGRHLLVSLETSFFKIKCPSSLFDIGPWAAIIAPLMGSDNKGTFQHLFFLFPLLFCAHIIYILIFLPLPNLYCSETKIRNKHIIAAPIIPMIILFQQ